MATINIFHDTRRAKQSGLFPVKLRVTHDRRSKYFDTGIELSIADYTKLSARKLPQELQGTKAELVAQEAKALKVLEQIRPFSFLSFERKYVQRSFDSTYVETVYEDYITKLRAQGRVGTADAYQSSMRSLIRFKKGLRFEDIDDVFLYKYEQWMLNEQCSITTVGIYLRCLRCIYNESIHAGLITRDNYPFGKRKYQMPTGKNVKKALKLSDIGKIYQYQPKDNRCLEYKAKAYWLFSYFANGMNVKDMALLKYKNITGDLLIFERAKTIRTARSNPKIITVVLTEDLNNIILKHGNWDKDPDNYIFPILRPGMKPTQVRDRIKDIVKDINVGVNRIAEAEGIKEKITTYTARHSFSTVLKRSGASIEFISESLGHHDVKTTESYLDSFETEMKRSYAKQLTSFKKTG